ncbi:MAG: hypothetical protein HC857_00095 [Synechococcales cyanobacterium RU_4_20]|nr:hypothetical protein [Synechococcales cyanobacterium RU_4_20]
MACKVWSKRVTEADDRVFRSQLLVDADTGGCVMTDTLSSRVTSKLVETGR